jgi:hypothetical protein
MYRKKSGKNAMLAVMAPGPNSPTTTIPIIAIAYIGHTRT